jgi:hypothetical protein
LRTQYGAKECDALIALAEAIPICAQPPDFWLDKLTPIQDIDPGEAQLFAAAAEASFLVMSGDKRALRALKAVEGFADALRGRVVTVEASLLGLCARLGPETVRRRIVAATASDTIIRICFSTDNPDPQGCLRSYYDRLADELQPLSLWKP